MAWTKAQQHHLAAHWGRRAWGDAHWWHLLGTKEEVARQRVAQLAQASCPGLKRNAGRATEGEAGNRRSHGPITGCLVGATQLLEAKQGAQVERRPCAGQSDRPS